VPARGSSPTPTLPRKGDGSNESRPVSWQEIFANPNPVEIEVGFGKGLFLLSSSQARPDVNFLGIEVFRKYQLFTANRLAKRNLTNVRLVCADARQWLAEHVPSGSVQAIHVFFPDPWWKKRHLKRRLFTPGFAVTVERLLQPGGRLVVVTDVGSYFQIIQELIAQHTGLTALPLGGENEPSHNLDYLTNFERKYRQEGRSIHRAVYLK
jgi:tRNA (guanine-N7-)-methyltransferase